MWLLKAVGVNDQLEFTFALQRDTTYTIGRDKGCNIRFNSKRLRVQEGTIEVGAWTTTDPASKPVVKYRPQNKRGKDEEFPLYKTLLLSELDEEENVGSTTLSDYEMVTLDNGNHGTILSDHDGQGIYYDDDAWFTLYWQDLYVVYDKMKDETDAFRETLKNYCIPWTPAFDTDRIPDFVFSNTYKANPECNYAVCYGVRILLPDYLREVVMRLGTCWKQRADGEDSFKLPDAEADKYRPPFDDALQAFRKNLESWLPDDRRPSMFKGWKILVLRSKATPGERRYLLAAGAELTDCDIITQPLLSAADFEKRIAPWLAEVDAQPGGRTRAVVAHFGQVKKMLTEAGKDFSVCIEIPGHRLGLSVTPGSIIWNAMRIGGVQKYLNELATNVSRDKPPPPDAPPTTRHTQVPETEPARPGPTPPPSAGPSQSSGSPSQSRPSFVPASQPDDTATRPSVEPMQVEAIDVPLPAQPTSTAKRALKRRVGKPMADLYVEPIPETPMDSGENSSLSQPRSQDQQTEPPAAQPMPSQSYAPDTIMPTQTQSAGTGRSRLKRRAGTQQPLVDYTIDETPASTAQTIRPDIQEVYEQATKRSDYQPIPKRARLASVDAGSESATPADTMDVDDGEEQLDFVERTLQRAAQAKKAGRLPSGQLMPPPKQIPAKDKASRSPSEESETIEPPRKAKRAASPIKKPSKGKANGTGNGQGESRPPVATQDTAFLQAIAKNAKSRKAIDELDKEFNQLRIPKPGAQPGSHVVKASAWDASHPDWNLVNDFDDDMRGNFIEIIRVDLMRKDGGRKEPVRTDNGVPNFKKFKKKDIIRREPVRMALVAPSANDPEMGEPYWPTQQPGGRRGKGATQMTLTQQPDDEEDDEMPLLPTARRRQLHRDNDDDDDMSPAPLTARARGRGTAEQPASQEASLGRPATQRGTARQTRQASVQSDVSVDPPVTRGTRASKPPTRDTRASAIVVEESEDEVNRDIGPARSSTGTKSRSTRIPATSEAGASASGRAADDEATTATGTATRAGKSQSTLGATGRRRLLVADDDDDGEMVFRGAAKKRRI